MPADCAAMLCGVVLPSPWYLIKYMLISTWGKDFRPWAVQSGKLDLRLLPDLGLLKVR